jgi:hypothetical protein
MMYVMSDTLSPDTINNAYRMMDEMMMDAMSWATRYVHDGRLDFER